MLDFCILSSHSTLQKTVCSPVQAWFCMISIWLGFCPPLHILFLLREVLSSLHTIDYVIFQVKSPTQSSYAKVTIHCIFANYIVLYICILYCMIITECTNCTSCTSCTSSGQLCCEQRRDCMCALA